MTLDLGPIKERAERATEGPWVFDRKATGGEASPSLFSNAKILGDLAPMPITTGTPFWTDSDFDFIAHARADIPALVAEVEALRAALGAERYHCDEAAGYIDRGPYRDAGRFRDRWLSEWRARRAPKIGGGE